MDIAPGSVIDKYVVEGVIGKGGMATVFRVRHAHLDSLHALKLLHLAGGSLTDRLIQEGRFQASLRHPNIVAVTDVVTWQGSPGLVMEFIAGPALDTLLEETALTLEQADAVAHGILRGVRKAHQEGLIHRDLKPGNILLAPADTGLIPKIADFGLAKVFAQDSDTSRTRSGQQMGTPLYMAPEQIKDAKGVDQRADIWALGAILYELVTGCRAFEGEDIFHIFDRIRIADFEPPTRLVPGLPPRMLAAIEGALVVEPEDRIPDCDTLLEVWRGVTTHEVDGGARAEEPSGPWNRELLKMAAQMASTGDEGGPAEARDSATWQGGGLQQVAPARASETLVASMADDGPVLSLDPDVVEAAMSLMPGPSRPPSVPSLARAGLFGGIFVAIGGTGALVLAGLAVAGIGWLALGGFAAAPETTLPTASELPAPAPAEPPAELPAAPAEEPPPPEPAADLAPRPAPAMPPARPSGSPEATPPQPALPEPASPGSPAELTTVEITGDASEVWLVRGGQRHPPGAVAPGTYQVEATFPGSSRGIIATEITVAPGERMVINCSKGFATCTVR